MSMKIALAFLMLAPALAQESTCSGEGGGQCEGSSASPMVDEQVLLQASVSMHSQLDLQSESARMSAVKRCSLSLISKATKTKANPSGCEEFGADLEKTVTDETIPAIKSGVGNDQKMHDLAEGGVNKCNEALSANSNLVANGANDVDVARKLHIECRSVEATHFDTSEAKSQALTSFLGSPQDPCGGTYPNQWKALAECFETQVNYHKQMNTTLYEKVEAYTKAHDEWQAKKDECTTSQAHFEVTYCGRHHLVENTIKNYDQCWEEATQSYEAVKVAVTASFDNHVKEYIAAQRLICLAKATKLTEEPTKAQAQLDHCHNMEVDTSELTLNIPADFPPEKKTPNFGVPSVYPGHPSWVGQEYASLSAAKSPHAAVTPCGEASAPVVVVSDEAAAAAKCKEKCLAKNYCCNDWKIGSNQMISCAQACMMRAFGTDSSKCNGLCDRHGGSGCSLTENGHTYGFCSRCGDLKDTCPHGVQNKEPCETGCAMNIKIEAAR